jgi:hypothetical protein
VRRVRDGDAPRAKIIGDHLRLVLTGLHMHDTGEDGVQWPRLLERAAPSTALVETIAERRRRRSLRHSTSRI